MELSHELDYVLWFFGPISEVVARCYESGSLEVDVEDTAQILLRCRDSLPVCVHLDFNRRHSTRRCVLRGTEGELFWDAVAGKVDLKSAGGLTKSRVFSQERDDLFRAQLRHFLGCIEQGNQPIVSLDDGRRTLELIEAARNSNRTGNNVP